MNNKEFAQFKERCLYSKTIYEKMKNGSFINDSGLMRLIRLSKNE